MSLNIADFREIPPDRAHAAGIVFGRSWGKESDHRHRRLLGARRQRPRRGAADKRDELAPPYHSITSSARASREGGTSMPSALAVLRFMTRSNLLARITGMSPGFSP